MLPVVPVVVFFLEFESSVCRFLQRSRLFAVANFCNGRSWAPLFLGRRGPAVTLRQLITSFGHKQLLGYVNWDAPPCCPTLQGFWSRRQFWCECSQTVRFCATGTTKKKESSNFRNCDKRTAGFVLCLFWVRHLKTAPWVIISGQKTQAASVISKSTVMFVHYRSGFHVGWNNVLHV